MATKTRAELIAQVLDNLGVIVKGQAPSDDDTSRIDDLIDATLASLEQREVAYIDDPGTASPPTGGAINLAVFLALSDVIANRAAPSFNLAGDPKLFVLAQQGEEELRVLSRPPKTRKMLTTDLQIRGRRHRYGFSNFTSGQ